MSERNMKNHVPRDILSRVDCQIRVYQEKIPDSGEDAMLYALNNRAVLVGAFDGCGGAGAKRYAKLQGKTGAYMASRVVCGTVNDWFDDCCVRNAEFSAQSLADRIRENLAVCDRVGGESSRFVSSMVKAFPTTAALAVLSDQDGKIRVDCFWAGDSRVYLLNAEGLAQLSVDDLFVTDALENLYEDGAMTNVISHSKPFTIHHGSLLLDQPAIVFAATDGCFGYLPTPMAFEQLLVNTLVRAESVEQWEQNLHGVIGRVAGDDYALSAAALDFGSFAAMKACFARRARYLQEYYPPEMAKEREDKNRMWAQYKPGYYRLQLAKKG